MNVKGFLFIYPLFMSMLMYGGFCNARGILPEKHGRYQCAVRSAGICRRCLYCRCARLAQKYAPVHCGGNGYVRFAFAFCGIKHKKGAYQRSVTADVHLLSF